MNIATIAPEKFALQDLVCVDLALRWGALDAVLIPEPKLGEDALLTWQDAGASRACEVQVKGAEGALTVELLAEHLVHFPERRSSETLLDRLMADPARTALFVVSGRCRDALSPLTVTPGWTGELRPAPIKGLATALLATIARLGAAPAKAGKAGKAPTKLVRERLAHLAQLAQTPVADLEAAIQRVFIQEQETRAVLDVRMQQRLLALGLPSDRLNDGVARLSDVVQKAKAQQADVTPRLRLVLSQIAPPSVAPQGYLDRGVETALSQDLAANGALLLSGPPRVGKTWMARQLAGRLQTSGFEVRQGSHIDEADRFLTDGAAQPRAYLLEDPLGARQVEPDSSDRAARLRRLLDALPPGRRLLVTQVEGPILQLSAAASLADCDLGGWRWTRLDRLEAPLARRLWAQDAEAAGVGAADIARIDALIAREPELRDAGAIAYLATVFDRIAPDASEAELIQRARGDAVDFARVLADADPAMGAILKAMAIATEPGTDLPARELAFIVDGGDARPSIPPRQWAVDLFSRTPPSVPAYAVEPALPSAQAHAMTVLQRRRVLEATAIGANFTHPYFRAGAQGVLRPDLAGDLPPVIADLERAVAAVEPRIPLAAARNLGWIAGQLSHRPEGLAAVLGVAETALGSVYPATRDAAFAFLMSRAGDLDDRQRARVDQWTHAVNLDLDDVEEVAGIAVITQSAANVFRFTPTSLGSVAPYVAEIVAGGVVDLDFGLARRILDAHSQAEADLPRPVVSRLLAADEAIIRAAAVEAWFSAPRNDDADFIDRVRRDPSPSVATALLKALVDAWPTLDGDRRQALIETLRTQARSPGVAVVLVRRLSLFDRVERFGEAPPWPLFSQLAGDALANAFEVSFADGRLTHALDQAVKAGEREGLLPLLETWTDGLLARLSRRLVDENELAVIDYLIEIGAPTWRWPRIVALLDQPNTAARVRMVESLVDLWDDLEKDERSGLLARFQGDRGDELWLKAAALTRHTVPAAVATACAGDPAVLDRLGQDFVDGLGEALFTASMHVYLGAPQPLWWIGGHHSRSPVWRRAVQWSAGAVSRPLFAAALEEVFDDPEQEAVVTSLIETADPADLQTVFDIFLDREIAMTGSGRKRSWVALLTRGEAEGLLDPWFERLVEAAPSAIAHLRELSGWIGDGAYRNRLLDDLKADLRAYQLIGTVEDMQALMVPLVRQRDATLDAGDEDAPEPEDDDEGYDDIPDPKESMGALLSIVRKALETDPPQIHGTWGDLREVFKKAGAATEHLDWIEERRLIAVERHFERRRTLATEDQSALADWLGPK